MAHQPEKRRGDWMQTYTGRQFFPLDPRPEDICIEDIAHALSNTCRYGGHSAKFYSVAEHSIIIATALPIHIKLQGLMHDATEAYLCDLPSPIKRCVSGYAEAEDRMAEAISVRFGLPLLFDPLVKEYDKRILLDEKEAVMLNGQHEWELKVKPLGLKINCYGPLETEEMFLGMFHHLTEGKFKNAA